MSDYKVFNDTGVERTWEELYEDNVLLQHENSQLKMRIEKIKHILNNQMDYREFVDIVNAIEEILKGDKE